MEEVWPHVEENEAVPGEEEEVVAGEEAVASAEEEAVLAKEVAGVAEKVAVVAEEVARPSLKASSVFEGQHYPEDVPALSEYHTKHLSRQQLQPIDEFFLFLIYLSVCGFEGERPGTPFPCTPLHSEQDHFNMDKLPLLPAGISMCVAVTS
ncbi:hypothetical protein DNTS_035607 [Danionella cerebrum]|uniref:Uncharacterized protein n=1 Tax=Danionella cerebrum TaxID=2873325 RepID=A0A553MUD1_9TELE|nr:hypothetical protein DNTS_035607 [Danionella translucida]